MKLKIRSIHEKGNAAEEYVLLSVIEDCDVVDYGLADTTYTSDRKVSNRLRHFYWFPTQKVKKGELVELHTGKGKRSSGKNGAEITVHRFFWNLGAAVWNDDGDAAILFEIASRKAFKA